MNLPGYSPKVFRILPVQMFQDQPELQTTCEALIELLLSQQISHLDNPGKWLKKKGKAQSEHFPHSRNC